MIAATGAAFATRPGIATSVEPDVALAPAFVAAWGRYEALYLALRPIL